MTFRPFPYSSLIPAVDDGYSLGSLSKRWKDGYFGHNSVHIVSTAEETGTAKDWSLGIAPDGKFTIYDSTIPIVQVDNDGYLVVTSGVKLGDNSIISDNAVTGTGTVGQIAYWSGNAVLTSESNAFTWDDANNRLGIGVSVPESALHVDSEDANTSPILTIENTAGNFQVFRSDATPNGSITGSVGDIVNDTTNGELYFKTSGSVTNSGWAALATKTYVDNVALGLDVKNSVRAATTGEITLSGTQTIDDVALVAGNRVLVKNQGDGYSNGIYVVDAGSWTRATDADSDADVTAGLFVFVEEGTNNGDSGWVLNTNNPITLGVTSLVFTQFSGAGQVTAGAGLTKDGNTINIGDGYGITVNADSIEVIFGTTGELTTVNAGDTASAGILNKAARADHEHAVSTAAPSVTVKSDATSASEGTATSLVRSDAQFVIDTANVVAIGSANAQGSSNSLARADHVHEHPVFASGDYHTEYLRADGYRGLTADLSAGGYRITNLATGVATKTSAYTVLETDDIILANGSGGAFALTMPAASTVSGRVYNFKKIDSSSNYITIQADGAETIDGSNTLDLTAQYESATLVSDGTAWYII